MSEGRPTTTTELSPLRREQVRRARRAEDRAWKKKCGPVTTSFMPCPDCGHRHDRRKPCPDDPAVEAEFGKPPARADEGGGLCPECGVEPSASGGRCFRCRGESMMEADSWE